MATYSELALALIVSADLFSTDAEFTKPVELAAEAVLSSTVKQTYRENCLVETTDVLSSLEFGVLGTVATYIYRGAEKGVTPAGYAPPATPPAGNEILPMQMPAPDGSLLPDGVVAEEVLFNAYRDTLWDLRLVFDTAGPIGVSAGETFDSARILSCEGSVHLSDAGSFSVKLQGIFEYLQGARAHIDVNLNNTGWTRLFTGWCLVDNNLALDYTDFTTDLELVDGLTFLSQRDSALTVKYKGTTNAILTGAASVHGNAWYAQWADGITTYTQQGQTRLEVIMDVLAKAGFPNGVEFPSNGDVIGWDVEATEEVPMDIIRHVAESNAWQFNMKADGTLRFFEAYDAGQEIAITYDEIDLDPGISLDWGKSPINCLEVKGTPRRFTAMDYIKSKLGDISYTSPNFMTATSTTSKAGKVQSIVSVTQIYWGLLTYTTKEKFPIRNITYGPAIHKDTEEEVAWSGQMLVNYQPYNLLGFPGPVQSTYFNLGSHAYERLDVGAGVLLAGISITGFSTDPTTTTEINNPPPVVNEEFNKLIIGYHYLSGLFNRGLNIHPVLSDGLDPADYIFPVYAEVLGFVEKDDQASVNIEDQGSIGAFGLHKQSTYENAFIDNLDRCQKVCDSILFSSHKMGELKFTCPFQLKHIDRVGSNISVVDQDTAVVDHVGVIEAMSFSFSAEGNADTSFQCSVCHETE